MVPGRAATTGAVPQEFWAGWGGSGSSGVWAHIRVHFCNPGVQPHLWHRGCGLVCSVCVWGPLGTFWLPTGLKPRSIAPSALISYNKGVVNSQPNDFSVCFGVWAGAGEEL